MNNAKSRLDRAQRTRLKDPLRCLFFGPEGVGKSTLAADAPTPIWLDIEDGSGRLEVTRYPFRDGRGGHVPQTYQEVLAAIEDLSTQDHPYRTVVIDTVDRLESLIWKFIIEREAPTFKGKLTNIEGFGYGRGYAIAVDEWRAFCLKLDRLRTSRDMSIVLLAHAQIRTFKSPTTDDYDRYGLRLNDKAAGFLREWCDIVGFACFEEGAANVNGDRARGVSTGRRLLKFERTAAYDAKARFALPAELELSISSPWAPLGNAIESAANMTIEQIKAAIHAECVRIGDVEGTKKVHAAVVEADAKSDSVALHRYLAALRTRPAITTPKEEASNV